MLAPPSPLLTTVPEFHDAPEAPPELPFLVMEAPYPPYHPRHDVAQTLQVRLHLRGRVHRVAKVPTCAAGVRLEQVQHGGDEYDFRRVSRQSEVEE